MIHVKEILTKDKPPPPIFDLVNTKAESEQEFNALIEKIPNYKIKPETVSNYQGSSQLQIF